MSLIDRIKSKEARIGVIGLGYVGLPLVIEFCKAGFRVTGFDVDQGKTGMLTQGQSYINILIVSASLSVLLCFPQRLISQSFRIWTALSFAFRHL